MDSEMALGIEFRTTREYDDELALMTTLSNTNFKLQVRIWPCCS